MVARPVLVDSLPKQRLINGTNVREEAEHKQSGQQLSVATLHGFVLALDCGCGVTI